AQLPWFEQPISVQLLGGSYISLIDNFSAIILPQSAPSEKTKRKETKNSMLSIYFRCLCQEMQGIIRYIVS
ncbi:hypothetical protein QKW61_014085, partial [Staphylococcus nepalensis]|nr:hypothetical protein [Staphylococcus nepalensis]